MRIQYMSDFHLEFHGDGGSQFLDQLQIVGDVLVIAGDVFQFSSFKRDDRIDIFKRICSHGVPVLYALGNHEHYGSSIKDVASALGRLERRTVGLSILKTGEPILVSGRRFLGGPMWFRQPMPNQLYARCGMADFHTIREFEPNVYEENRKFIEYMQRDLREGDVVVTHHVPSLNSVASRFKGSQLNPFFVCEMDSLILERKPAAWIHGHTHDAFDYVIGSTRIVCNPLGYPGEFQGRSFVMTSCIDI
jgi:Icc-related predicted phosphoesterase